jgi:tripartite ATP-independent transporter DctM subunit
MFILAANILNAGYSASRVINLVKTFVGHLPGGLPITTTASCTLFGAISGSTQATVAAIGGVMRPMLLKAGYSSSFSLALIINSSDIALLIPPSIASIVYGVATNTSINKLFLAGIGPGILIFVLFSIYNFLDSKIRGVGQLPKASWHERQVALKEAALVMLFPIIIIGGIFCGIFSPTEASAAAVGYALILEGLIYKTLKAKKLFNLLLETGVITAVVFILVGAGQALTWVLSYMRIPQEIMPAIMGSDPSQLKIIITIVVTYFIACMFVDPIVAIYILSPIFNPYIIGAGIDPVFMGILVVLQAAIGSASPPFGCDIFTAQLIFRRPYLEVIKKTYPFMILLIVSTVLLILFPSIATFIPNMSLE